MYIFYLSRGISGKHLFFWIQLLLILTHPLWKHSTSFYYTANFLLSVGLRHPILDDKSKFAISSYLFSIIFCICSTALIILLLTITFDYYISYHRYVYVKLLIFLRNIFKYNYIFLPFLLYLFYSGIIKCRHETNKGTDIKSDWCNFFDTLTGWSSNRIMYIWYFFDIIFIMIININIKSNTLKK